MNVTGSAQKGGIDNLNPLKDIFRKIYHPEAFHVLYLFGDFHHLNDVNGIYAIIELKMINDTDISVSVCNVSQCDLHSVKKLIVRLISES